MSEEKLILELKKQVSKLEEDLKRSYKNFEDQEQKHIQEIVRHAKLFEGKWNKHEMCNKITKLQYEFINDIYDRFTQLTEDMIKCKDEMKMDYKVISDTELTKMLYASKLTVEDYSQLDQLYTRGWGYRMEHANKL